MHWLVLVKFMVDNDHDINVIMNEFKDESGYYAYNFKDIRPMNEKLNIDPDWGEKAKIVYLNDLVDGQFISDGTRSHKDIVNLIDYKGVNYDMIPAKAFDTKISLAKDYIRKLPKGKHITKLNPYGDVSEDLSYLWEGTSKSPKNQADMMMLGRIMLDNLISTGSYTANEWKQRNWGVIEDPLFSYMKSSSDDTGQSIEYFYLCDSIPVKIVQYMIDRLSTISYSYSVNMFCKKCDNVNDYKDFDVDAMMLDILKYYDVKYCKPEDKNKLIFLEGGKI